MKTPLKRRRAHAEYLRRWRARKVADGGCSCCGGPRDQPQRFKTCADCREVSRLRRRYGECWKELRDDDDRAARLRASFALS